MGAAGMACETQKVTHPVPTPMRRTHAYRSGRVRVMVGYVSRCVQCIQADLEGGTYCMKGTYGVIPLALSSDLSLCLCLAYDFLVS